VHKPHTCRHTWATWHYAIHRDLLKLRDEGGWSAVALVERHVHLMPSGHEDGIKAIWGVDQPAAIETPERAKEPDMTLNVDIMCSLCGKASLFDRCAEPGCEFVRGGGPMCD
jgi:hypothetical protein